MDLKHTAFAGALLLTIAGCVSAQSGSCAAAGQANNCSAPSIPAPEAVRKAARQPSPAIVIPPVVTRPQPAPALPDAGTAPAAPAVKGICGPGGCTGTDAQSYRGNNGATYLNNAGRPCHRNGVWMQCF
jgi:hypothetical protein